jgi:hypothetical protein
MKTYATLFILAAATYFLFFRHQEEKVIRVGNAPRFQIAETSNDGEKTSRTSASLEKTASAPIGTSQEKRNSHPEIMALLQSNDACALQNLLRHGTVEPGVLADVYLEYAGLEYLRPLIGSTGVFYKPVDNPADENQKFFQALAQSDLINSQMIDYIKPNPEKSLETLAELSRKNPKNAFYPFLILMTQVKLGKKDAELAPLQKLLAASEEFENPLDKISQEIHSHYWDNAAVHVLVQSSYRWLPNVSIYPAMNSLQRLPMDASDQEHLAEVMTRQGRSSTKSYYSQGYNIGQYNLGASLVPGKYVSFEEMDESRPRPDQKILDEYPYLDSDNCDQAPMDAFLKEHRNAY